MYVWAHSMSTQTGEGVYVAEDHSGLWARVNQLEVVWGLVNLDRAAQHSGLGFSVRAAREVGEVGRGHTGCILDRDPQPTVLPPRC